MICKFCNSKIKGKIHRVKGYISCDYCFKILKLFRIMSRDRGFGGTDKKMFWDEYISMYKTKKMRVGLEKLKNYIIKNNLLGIKGLEYQNSNLYGKYGIYLSLRAWGDFMASLMNTIEGERKYDYTNFAWY